MKMRNLAVILPLALSAALFVMGCGGGSGESVNYQGETMPAVIDTTDAVSKALDVTFAGEDALDHSLGMGSSGRPSLRDPVGAFNEVKDKIFQNGIGAFEPLIVAENQATYGCSVETLTGSHGGSATMEMCVYSDKFIISITANAYATTTMYVDGEMILTERSASASIVWRDWTFQDASTLEDYYTDGWVNLTALDEDTTRFVFNVTVTDNYTGDDFYLKDYTIVYFEHPSDSNLDWVTIDGRYYDAVDGYVDIDTSEALMWTWDSGSVPTNGILRFTGANGCWIQIDFDTTSFSVSVDYTGDDTADWTSMPIPWV